MHLQKVRNFVKETLLKKGLEINLPENISKKWTFSAERPRDKFINQRRNTDQNDVTYYAQCPEGNCQEGFAVETERSLSKRVIDNSGRNKHSHVLFVIKLYAPNKSILCIIGVWPLFSSRQIF